MSSRQFRRRPLPDREATTDKACALVKQAAAGGAQLVAFPEGSHLPRRVWRTTSWADGRYVRELYANAVEVPGPVVARLGEATAEAGVYAAVGVNEIEGRSTTRCVLSPDGQLVRVPPGRLSGAPRWGFGGLIRWENYMPLARAAMYAQGVDIYLAPTWDNSDVWGATLRHIAKEGRVHVVGVAPCLRGSDVPQPFRGDIYGGEDDWMSRGFSTIVAAGGEIVAGPVTEREQILYADLDVDAARAQRRQFDPIGHYARPDVFHLTVDTQARRPVDFT